MKNSAMILTMAAFLAMPALVGAQDAEPAAGDGAQDVAFKCAAASRDIYGVLVVRNAYVPVSAEVFKVRLHVLQD